MLDAATPILQAGRLLAPLLPAFGDADRRVQEFLSEHLR